MDSHPYTPHAKHNEMLEQHRLTWHGLTRVGMVAAAAIFVLLALMATFLTGK